MVKLTHGLNLKLNFNQQVEFPHAKGLCVFSKVIPEPSNIKKSVKYVPGPVFGCSIGYKNNSSYFVHTRFVLARRGVHGLIIGP
jgi:hypothetical protein